MVKGNAINGSHSFRDEALIVQVQQDPRKRILLTVGILGSAIAIGLAIVNRSFLGNSIWWLLIPFGYLLLDSSIELILRVFISPQRMSIRENVVVIARFNSDDVVVNVTDVEEIRSLKMLGLMFEASGWMLCPARQLQFFISKRYYEGFDKFISELESKNPRCTIDKRILDWKGPYSSM